MKAYQLVDRKIVVQKKGAERLLHCFVDSFEAVDGKAQFEVTTVTGKRMTLKDGEFAFDLAETEVESEARKAYLSMKKVSEYPQELIEQHKMIRDMVEQAEKRFEEAKQKLISLRLEKSKVHRQYYNEGQLHVFYDIKHGKNVDNFQTLKEIEEMKARFAKVDILRGVTELTHLQAFDEDGNLVIDEWN